LAATPKRPKSDGEVCIRASTLIDPDSMIVQAQHDRESLEGRDGQ
jgi:hypothetical protein